MSLTLFSRHLDLIKTSQTEGLIVSPCSRMDWDMEEPHTGMSGSLMLVMTVSSSAIKAITLLNLTCLRMLCFQPCCHKPAPKQRLMSQTIFSFCLAHCTFYKAHEHLHTLGFVLYQMSSWTVGCHLLQLGIFNMGVCFVTVLWCAFVLYLQHKRESLLTCPHTSLSG